MALKTFNSTNGFSVGTAETVVIDSSGNIFSSSANISGNVQAQYYIGDGSLLTGIAPTVQVYEFANVVSTGGYFEAEWLGNFTAGAEGSVTTEISTTATYMGGFITQSGYPNITVLPIGVISVRIETEKVSGTKAYSVYAEIYSRTEAGSETLLLTTDVSTPNSTNFGVQQNLITYITNNITLNTTDRIVVKFYGSTVSGTDNVAINFDGATGSGVQLPALPASAGQFLPYVGATANTNLGTYSLTANVITANSISSLSYTGNISARIIPRVVTVASSATPTPNGDTTDQYDITALAVAATIGAPTGTPVDGQKLTIRILDDGTPQTLAWNAIYEVIGTTLPTTTVANKYIYVGCIFNAQSSKWDVVSVASQV